MFLYMFNFLHSLSLHVPCDAAPLMHTSGLHANVTNVQRNSWQSTAWIAALLLQQPLLVLVQACQCLLPQCRQVLVSVRLSALAAVAITAGALASVPPPTLPSPPTLVGAA